MTKLLVLALCVCLGMSMSVKERLAKSEALNESQEEFGFQKCEPGFLGDGVCHGFCNNEMNNWDNGDCECKSSQIGDGGCDFNCNKEQFNFDGGDCAGIY